jgi:hypothetical protein
MKFRPIVAAGMGIAAVVALSAAATPAMAASSAASAAPNLLGGLLNASGNQGSVFANVDDNQAHGQLAGGQVIELQGNGNPNARLFGPGDIADVAQGNRGKGDSWNQDAISQAINHGGVGGGSLLAFMGNQGAIFGQATDNQALIQGAAGQLLYGQGNLNLPLRGGSPGDNGNVWQGNLAKGTAGNDGSLDQSINHGGVGRKDMFEVIGNQIAGGGEGADNQGAGQVACGECGLIQANANGDGRLFSDGDNGSVTQKNVAQGDAGNNDKLTQKINHEGVGNTALGAANGNQGGGFVAINDNQPNVQGAVGQGVAAQGNLNVVGRAFSAGNDGPVTQTNDASGSACNYATGSQTIVH